LAPTVGPAPYDMAMGAEAMKRLLELPSRPDAVYCLADVLAVGALHELHVHGLTVPDDMAMAAFDGTELSRFMVPTLTSLAPDIVELSRLAVSAVINGADGDSNRVRLCAYQLVVGESTAARNQLTSRKQRQH
jgi:DNA-binding LacI/PurR family transcriptional regulator